MPDVRMHPDEPVVGEGFIGAGADDEGPGAGFMAADEEELGAGTAERAATVDELMTGDEYVESLRDGRGVYIYGEKVDDVTTHPAFRNAVLSTRRLYDAMHDPATRDKLCDVDRFGIRTHKFFHPAYSPQDLLGGRDAIAEWSKLSYGFRSYNLALRHIKAAGRSNDR